ncbi:hypothetical protein GPL15_18910 [Clostridium sp. MCC353]|uniref:hypothetical protein n=1 Tax=Clostridium sp. MCC353 TaxID=2592646 RepID=UPI001C014832|nr:hypothetical protein [Clostridium sp. MCC353]MBT9778572.1 hypothetical protein [Clostridium sp. MCC353]
MKHFDKNQWESNGGGGDDRTSTLDLKIAGALNREAEKLPVSSWYMENMKRSVHNRIQEGNRMKRYSIKKIIVTAAVVCALGSITAVAAGRIVGIGSHSSWKEAFYDYEQVDKLEQKLGYTMKAPESFSNGFAFSSGMPKHQEAQDESGNVVKKAEGAGINYSKKGMADISLEIEQAGFVNYTKQPDQKFSYNGITFNYSQDNYRFVPPDYQVSEEEQAAMDAGKLYISYGTDKVENNVVQNMYWEDGGTVYTLLAFDSTLGPEDFYEMACEVVDAE